MKGGWSSLNPGAEVTEYLEGGGKTGKSGGGKKYSADNNWSPKPDAGIQKYLETGKSEVPEEPRKTTRKTENNQWNPKPGDEVLKYLDGGGIGANGKIGEKLAQAMVEPDMEDYLETFERWNGNHYSSDKYSSDKKAYESVGNFKPLPATVDEVEEFLDRTENSRAGLFASYCLNEIYSEDKIELKVEKPHNYLGAYNSGKRWRIHGNVGNQAGFEMSGGELVVDGNAGHHFCGNMSGGKAVLYRSAGEFAGTGMRGGELQVNGSVRGYAGNRMQDGRITVQGSAGEAPGSEMEGGKVVICGNAGLDAGKRMRGGELVVIGDAGEQAGLGMKGGTLTIDGDVNDRAGGAMEGGELHINGDLSKGWTYELAYGITGGSIFHKGKQLYKDGRRVRKWLIF